MRSIKCNKCAKYAFYRQQWPLFDKNPCPSDPSLCPFLGPASFPYPISSPCFSRGRFGPPIPWIRHDEKSHADGRARSCKCMTRIHSSWDIVPSFIKAFFSNSIILKFEIERENKRYRFSRLTRLISSFKQKSVKSDKSVAQRKFSNSRIRDRKRI